MTYPALCPSWAPCTPLIPSAPCCPCCRPCPHSQTCSALATEIEAQLHAQTGGCGDQYRQRLRVLYTNLARWRDLGPSHPTANTPRSLVPLVPLASLASEAVRGCLCYCFPVPVTASTSFGKFSSCVGVSESKDLEALWSWNLSGWVQRD